MELTTASGLLPAGAPRELFAEEVPAAWRALVLGPHPDDFDAIGVTLRRLADNGNPLFAAVVRTGSGVLDSYAEDLNWERKAVLREREQRASLRFFGLPEACAAFLALDNDSDEGQLCDTPRNREALAALLAEQRPDLVFLPHGNDTNSAHRALYAMVRDLAPALARPAALLLIRDPKTVRMRTDLYVPFGDEEAAWKAQLLRFHDTQHQRNLLTRAAGFDDRILGGNRQIAQSLGIPAPYAEAFEVERLAGR